MLNADTIDNMNCALHLNGIIAIIRGQYNRSNEPTRGIKSLILGIEPQPGTKCIHHTSVGDAISRPGDAAEKNDGLSRSLSIASQSLEELVSITPKVSNLFNQASGVLRPNYLRFETQLTPLRERAFAVRSELQAWCSAQPATIGPVTVRRFTQPYKILFPDARELTCTTLRADIYTDRRCAEDLPSHVLRY